ncbi:serine/arginine repetitive matrix protein 2 [Spatholobus suberectus]|nr:serine/arginine repetitive matrix protein 2 [Spatholobus suberectus]
METVCLHCGDRGFPKTLVFCTECKAYALHRYCLKGPVIFIDEVTWFCEDCATKLGVPPSLDQTTPRSLETRDFVNLKNNAIQITRVPKNCIERVKKQNKQRKKKITKKQKKGKVNNSALVAKTKVMLSDSHSSPKLEHPHCSISREEESKLENNCGPPPKDVANSDVGFKSVPVSQGATNNDSNCVELEGDGDAQPVSDIIWRGSMYFCNETIGTVSGLLVHLSDLACSKVVEEAGHLPEVLHVELLPRSMVWPESFKSGGPTDKDIALFLFPDSEGAEKDFDKLVDDIICLELAIRFVAKNAVLLIFPSTVLPIHYWRFEAKYYLWGVFRRKQTSNKTNDAVCRG